MATSNLKSAGIVGYDSQPPYFPTAGEGAPGYSREVDGYVTALAADAAGSTYRLVRVPSNAKMKSLSLDAAAEGAGAVNIGLYYSDSPYDGTSPSLQGTVLAAALFAATMSVATAQTSVNIINQSGNYPINLRSQPLWMAAGLAADPGGNFDIVAVVTTAFTNGGVLGVTAHFCD